MSNLKLTLMSKKFQSYNILLICGEHEPSFIDLKHVHNNLTYLNLNHSYLNEFRSNGDL